MLLACKRAGVSAAKCLYVGDAERDIEAGNSVNMKTFVASWGYIGETDDISQWQADVILQKPLDLLTHISWR